MLEIGNDIMRSSDDVYGRKMWPCWANSYVKIHGKKIKHETRRQAYLKKYNLQSKYEKIKFIEIDIHEAEVTRQTKNFT